jgi:hypothetical protein
MNTFFERMESTLTEKVTENGAMAYSSSLVKVLDMFALGGAYRSRTDEDICSLFYQAYTEDKVKALVCLFYLRDVRGGQGERRFFRVVFHKYYPIFVTDFGRSKIHNLLYLVAEYGRWDDLVEIAYAHDDGLALSIIISQLRADLSVVNARDRYTDEIQGSVSLLAKWMPSINTSSKETVKKAQFFARKIGYSYKEYRKTLSTLRSVLNILEQKMSAQEWASIDYPHVPSQAMFKHVKAFKRHDEERYTEYRQAVLGGTEKVNTSTLYPYQIVEKVREKEYAREDANMLWYNLPNYVGKDMKALVVADVSNSMTWGDTPYHPMSVSIALAIYFAERNTGAFAGKYMTFSSNPKLISVPDTKDIYSKVSFVEDTGVGYSTNINAVFDIFLQSAQLANKKDVPNTLIFVTDMEFDSSEVHKVSNFDRAKQAFKEAGVEMPKIVFWNASARNDTIPVRYNEDNVVLVSGLSPSVFSSVTGGADPVAYMNSVLESERYASVITALNTEFVKIT